MQGTSSTPASCQATKSSSFLLQVYRSCHGAALGALASSSLQGTQRQVNSLISPSSPRCSRNVLAQERRRGRQVGQPRRFFLVKIDSYLRPQWERLVNFSLAG